MISKMTLRLTLAFTNHLILSETLTRFCQAYEQLTYKNNCDILVFKVNKSGTHYQITLMETCHMERVFEEEILFRL